MSRTRTQEIQAAIETGDFSSPQASSGAASSTRLVVATYNIRYAVGSRLISGGLLRRLGVSRPSRRARLVESNLDRVALALKSNKTMPHPDVIALQEADAGTLRAGRHRIAPELARRLAMRYAFAGMSTPRDVPEQTKQWYLDFEERIAIDDEGDTGVALLSRLPFASATRVDLPWEVCPWRPRLCIHASFRVGSRSLHVFNSHIDTHAATFTQLAQHDAVLRRADFHAGRGEPVLLVGDFNTLTRSAARHVRGFLESRGYTTPFSDGTTTWRAGLIRLQPDWVFARNLRIIRHGVAILRGVSDHFPIWVEIDLASEAR